MVERPSPAAPRPPSAADVERERARARGARRLLPWAFLTAAGGGLIAVVAGGGARAGLALAALGLVFALFLLTTAIARCPACGAALGRAAPGPGDGTGLAGGRPIESCPRCRARFE
jgi:Flp pilus assembly protein TadB